MLKTVGALALVSLCLVGGCERGDELAAADERLATDALESWRKLKRCLVGEPLAEGEKASERMRRSDLTLVVTGEKSEWPKVCGEFVEKLHEQAGGMKGDAAVAKFAALKKSVGMLEGTGSEMYVADVGAPLVDALFDAAHEAGLEPVPEGAPELPRGPTAPAPAEPLATDQLALLGESDGYIARVELAPGSSVRFMLGTDDDKNAFYCRLTGDKKPLERAACSALKRKPSIISAPLSAEQPDADFYFDKKPEPAIWPLDGESIQGSFGASSFVYENGQIADIHETPTGPELIRHLPDRGVRKAPMPKVPGGKWIGYRAGAAVWRGPILGNVFKSAVVVYDIGADAAAVSGKIESGLVPPDIKHLEACRSGEVLTLALVGEPSKRDKEPERTVAMLFGDGSSWTDAVFGRVIFPPDADWDATWWRSLSCKEKEGVLTWAMKDGKIHQLRCTPEGCTEKHSAPLAGHGRMQKLRVADLDGKAFVIRVLRGRTPLGGVSDAVVMRLGPVEKLATAPEQVLLGDAGHLGLPHLDKSLGLVHHGGVAVPLLHSGSKVYGVRIDAAGKASKLAVK